LAKLLFLGLLSSGAGLLEFPEYQMIDYRNFLYYYGTEIQEALMNWVCEYDVYLVLVGKPHAKHLLVSP
jgi:hypothetical protein